MSRCSLRSGKITRNGIKAKIPVNIDLRPVSIYNKIIETSLSDHRRGIAMNRLFYRIADPTKNITVLVTNEIDKEHYVPVATQLLRVIKDAEQVAFLVEPHRKGSRIGLCMMGGEFCGNATLSAAALMAQKDGLKPEEESDIQLDVSGADHALTCHIKAHNPTKGFFKGGGRQTDLFTGTLEMPLPKSFTAYQGLPAVCFRGIIHIIVPVGMMKAKAIEESIRSAAHALRTPALGMLLWDEKNSYMTPCVYVRDTDSLTWERGCASGSAAIGAWRAYKAQTSISTDVHQPGGMIRTDANHTDGKITKLAITGQVILR